MLAVRVHDGGEIRGHGAPDPALEVAMTENMKRFKAIPVTT
jgi:hypothetical protein